MFIYPQPNPVALQLGPLKIYWYGLLYLVGFALAWVLGRYRARRDGSWTVAQIDDLIFYGALGVILGGRLGYMMFYQPWQMLSDPLSIFRTWEGGMSFHGGLLGVFIALLIFARSYQKNWLDVADFLAPLVPPGLAAGRLGNFINGELWGRVTDVPWGMVYPQVGAQPRHPSQLYELGMEGLLLFLIVWWFSAKPRPRGAVTAVFLIGYGVFRCTAEFFRQPDSQYGFLLGHQFTMGQLLSLPMIAIGLILVLRAYSLIPRCEAP